MSPPVSLAWAQPLDLGRLDAPVRPALDGERVYQIGHLVELDLGGPRLVGRVLAVHAAGEFEWSGITIILSSGRMVEVPGEFVASGLVVALPRKVSG